MSRRGFLRRAAGGVAALGAGALLAGRALGANERLSIGIIGAGDRGSALLGQIIGLAKTHHTEVTAVCDVWQVNLGKAATRARSVFGREPGTFTRFRDLLSLKDVDAVAIATPDFGHASILIEALKAGKDAYVEKPMATDVAEASQALDLARAGNRVVQAGTQYRSHGGGARAGRRRPRFHQSGPRLGELQPGALGPVLRRLQEGRRGLGGLPVQPPGAAVRPKAAPPLALLQGVYQRPAGPLDEPLRGRRASAHRR
jgi:hypothetical protein